MKKGYIYILLTAFLFSSMEIALKIASAQFNPFQLIFLRFVIGSSILLPPAVKGLKKRHYSLKGRDFAFFALTGFIFVVLSLVFYHFSILYLPASVVAILASCNPVFVVLLAHVILHEKIYRHTVFSILLFVFGILVIIDPLHITGSITGIVLVLLSAVAFSFYSVIGRSRSERYGGFALTCFSFLLGSMEILLLILITKIGPVSAFLLKAGRPMFADIPILRGLHAGSLLPLIYIGVVVTGFGFTFYFMAMEATSAATASLVFYIKPMLAPLLAFLILHEHITGKMAAGIALILTGSLICFIGDYQNDKKSEKSADSPTVPCASDGL